MFTCCCKLHHLVVGGVFRRFGAAEAMPVSTVGKNPFGMMTNKYTVPTVNPIVVSNMLQRWRKRP